MFFSLYYTKSPHAHYPACLGSLTTRSELPDQSELTHTHTFIHTFRGARRRRLSDFFIKFHTLTQKKPLHSLAEQQLNLPAPKLLLWLYQTGAKCLLSCCLIRINSSRAPGVFISEKQDHIVLIKRASKTVIPFSSWPK